MKRILLLSGKGGTGKTTVSSALIRLSQAKAVADCDVDAPNLHLVLQEKEKAASLRTNLRSSKRIFRRRKSRSRPGSLHRLWQMRAALPL